MPDEPTILLVMVPSSLQSYEDEERRYIDNNIFISIDDRKTFYQVRRKSTGGVIYHISFRYSIECIEEHTLGSFQLLITNNVATVIPKPTGEAGDNFRHFEGSQFLNTNQMLEEMTCVLIPVDRTVVALCCTADNVFFYVDQPATAKPYEDLRFFMGRIGNVQPVAVIEAGGYGGDKGSSFIETSRGTLFLPSSLHVNGLKLKPLWLAQSVNYAQVLQGIDVPSAVPVQRLDAPTQSALIETLHIPE